MQTNNHPNCQTADKLHEHVLFSGSGEIRTRRPPECKSGALPAELQTQIVGELKNPVAFSCNRVPIQTSN